MPVDHVTEGATIATAWGNQVADAVAALEANPPGYFPGGTDVAVADGGTGASSAANARTNLGLGPTNTPVFQGVTFPATDVPNAGPNTLDDYEEGSWTPAATFATPGSSTWTGVTANGTYQKIGSRVYFGFLYQATLAKGSAAGQVSITGLPFTSGAANRFAISEYAGITKAGYTAIGGLIAGSSTTASLRASGSGQAVSNVSAADMVDGPVTFAGYGFYTVAGALLGLDLDNTAGTSPA